MYERLSHWSRGLQDRMGPWPTATIVSLSSMLLAAMYVRPAVKTVALGALYARMSEDPFTFIPGNYVAFRILTPLISWLLGLRGELIIVTNLLAAGTLLILVFVYFSRHLPHPGDAITAVLLLAFSLPTLTTVYYGGYTDSVTYVIVFLMWWHHRTPSVFYPLLLLGLLNRESVLFLVPWFLYLQVAFSGSQLRTAGKAMLGYVLVFAVFYVYRRWVGTFGDIPFTAEYYLDPVLDDPLHWFKRSYPESWIGVFSVFKTFWIIPFIAALAMWRRGDRRQLLSMVLLLACAYAQLIVAFDSSRMLTLGFMVLPISLIYLFQHNGYEIRRWIIPLLVFNLFVPQLYTAAHIVEFMHSVPARLFQSFVLGNSTW